MKTLHWILPTGLLLLAASLMLYAAKTDSMTVLTGKQAFSNTASLRPGLAHKITAQDLPKPGDTPSGRSGGAGPRPADAMPQAPAGFKVSLYVSEGLNVPRQIRTAPNGDYFMADTGAGEIEDFPRHLRPRKTGTELDVRHRSAGSTSASISIRPGRTRSGFMSANTTILVAFPYKNGDLKASGLPEKLIPDIPGRRPPHARYRVFQGRQELVRGGRLGYLTTTTARCEFHRANILEYTPEGKFVEIYASGIRNPVGLAINPETGELWTSINERDTYGDNLVPDYVTHVERGGFYGWPWFYIGGNYDPKHQGKHPELQEQSDRSRCSGPAAQRFAGHGLLRWQTISKGVFGRRFCRRARLLEPRRGFRPRSHPDPA